jgi:hypothetical protein
LKSSTFVLERSNSSESLEVVSKPHIRLKSKAQTDENAQSRLRRDEQYILKRFATQLLSLRWGFETTSWD